jgi:hypothetical protein
MDNKHTMVDKNTTKKTIDLATLTELQIGGNLGCSGMARNLLL